MSKVLALCETPYQIIVVSKIISTFYKNTDVDIIITNHISGGEELVNRLKKSNLFNDAFYLKTKNLKRNAKIDSLLNYINKYLRVNKLLKEADYRNNKYNTFLFCNIDIVSQHLITFLNRHSTVEVVMFEDGLSSYTELYGKFFRNYTESINILDKIRYRLLRGKFSLIEGIYVFNPQYVEWKSYFPIIGIPKITKKDEKLIQELNQIFLYTDSRNEYNYKYIYFEESYFADGYAVNDIELVNKISQLVGKENIVIKIHPRNPINRFKKYGYNTNKITSIPWEIIALNMKLEDKVLITIASGSVMNPLIIMGMNLNAIMLFNYEELKAELLNDLIKTIELICKENTDSYSLPVTFNELKQRLLLS
ncbi:MAG TPA: hypothetical protein DCM59_18120 [Clostridium sp.]|nr:hypothetical protein [Clostridium sp.]